MEGFQSKGYTTASHILTQIARILIILPLAPFISRFIPPILIGGWNIDIIIGLVLAYLLVWLVAHLLRRYIIPIFIICVVILIFNQYTHLYTFVSLLTDYTAAV